MAMRSGGRNPCRAQEQACKWAQGPRPGRPKTPPPPATAPTSARACRCFTTNSAKAPIDTLKELELELDFTARLVYTEELKDFPYSDVWNYFCLKNDVPIGLDWLQEVREYEAKVLRQR